MEPNIPERTEAFLGYVRGTLYITVFYLALFTISLAIMALDVDGTLAPAVTRFMFPLVPVLMVIGVALNARQRKGFRFSKGDPAVRAVLDDEQRRQAFSKAFKAAFIVTLLSQFPLAALFMLRPIMRLAMGSNPLALGPVFMGAFTLVIGAGSLICFFLHFDRE